jgi:hypothetical protein
MRACSFLAGLSSRVHHGALRSGGCVDRGVVSNYRIDRGCGARNWRNALVVPARDTRKDHELNGRIS